MKCIYKVSFLAIIMIEKTVILIDQIFAFHTLCISINIYLQRQAQWRKSLEVLSTVKATKPNKTEKQKLHFKSTSGQESCYSHFRCTISSLSTTSPSLHYQRVRFDFSKARWTGLFTGTHLPSTVTTMRLFNSLDGQYNEFWYSAGDKNQGSVKWRTLVYQACRLMYHHLWSKSHEKWILMWQTVRFGLFAGSCV